MNYFIKIFKLLLHNFIYFLILNIGFYAFCIETFEYSIFENFENLIIFIISIIILSLLTHFFLIKTLKNLKISIFLLFIILLSVAFCISPNATAQGLIPRIFSSNIHFFFYEFFPTWAYINQGLYLISHIYQHNLDKNKII